MDKGTIVLLGHGSRRTEANDVLVNITEIIKPKFTNENIGYAFLEFAEPNINDFLEKCVSDGSRLIYVMPYFLYAGNHVYKGYSQNFKGFFCKIQASRGCN